MAESTPLTPIEKNNRIFVIIWIVLEILFCFMYGFYAHTSSYDIVITNGLRQYVAAVGIAIATIIGLGGVMTFVVGLKWSGFAFALLITVLSYQYYFLLNAFWTKTNIQRTFADIDNNNTQLSQSFGNDFLIWVSQAFAGTYRTFGTTATGAFKMALTLTIAFSAVVGRAGPLEILIFVLVGGTIYELNRQIIVQVNYDIGGSITIFMFGGIQGTITALLLAFTKQKQDLEKRRNYTSSKFNILLAILGSAFFWVFYPTIFLDTPNIGFSAASNTSPFLDSNGMINAYWAISSCVVTSLALSAIIYGRIRVKDLMYGTFAGAAIIGTSSAHIFNPIAAILLGIIAGLIQPLFNIIEEKLARGRIYFSTCAPFVFGVQGLIGSLAAGILRAIQNNTSVFNYSLYPYPFKWQQAGEYYRATFISFGIAIGSGALVGTLIYLMTAQATEDYFEDSAYFMVKENAIKENAIKENVIKQDVIEDNVIEENVIEQIAGDVQQGRQIKGNHSYC